MKKETLQVRGKKQRVTYEVAQAPTEGKWFWVIQEEIHWELFDEERKDPKQEETRQHILEARKELNANSEKYARPFRVHILEKEWTVESAAKLDELACNIGDHNEDWVELGLEWAQRITNGESWEDVCNKSDTLKWHRLIKWKDGNWRITGGALENKNLNPPSNIGSFPYFTNDYIKTTVSVAVDY